MLSNHHGVPGAGGSQRPGRKSGMMKVAVGASIVGIGASSAWSYRQNQKRNPGARLRLNSTLVEAIAGGVGEIAQICVLYPLDTIKVRCQSGGLSAGQVIKEMCAGGLNVALVRQMYVGVFGAALCSILVGGVHYASYESSRRHILESLTAPPPSPHSNTTSTPTPSVAHDSPESRSAPTSSKPALTSQPQASQSQPASSTHTSTAQHQQDHGAAVVASITLIQSGVGSPVLLPAQQPVAESPWLNSSRLVSNVVASVFAALTTAVVESPVELFRHNAQAGLVQGNFLKEMVKVVRKEGPAGLYWGFLPHCFEAWPHDISELLLYGFLKDRIVHLGVNPLPSSNWLSGVPLGVWDMANGAVSGGFAAVVSMPFDCVKTYMQTHGTDLAGKGLLGSARLFIRTGHKMVATRGMSSLYVGMVPRLLQAVPSATICWSSIEWVKRVLLPYTDIGSSPELQQPLQAQRKRRPHQTAVANQTQQLAVMVEPAAAAAANDGSSSSSSSS